MPADLDELESEQHYLRYAYDCLAAMRHRAEELRDGTDRNADLDLWAALSRRVSQLAESSRPLCFGRLDTTVGDTFYVGRRHVEDQHGEPVVVEWRAPVAEPFYRASPAAPMGLRMRRQFVVDGRHLHSMADDRFEGAAAAEDDGTPRLRGGDALMAELERSRTGEMLDIVATIQAEQDEVIRAPQAGVLAVQGGPGSGKTAVGLHRAAFLLYGNDVLARQGVLVLGPNRTFLRYIAQVLPSLGEEAVVQTTFVDLLAGVRVRAQDNRSAARVKGDVRMAQVLRAALDGRRRPLDGEIAVQWGAVVLRVTRDEANTVAQRVAAARLAWAAGRDALRQQLVSLLLRQHVELVGTTESTDYQEVERELRSSPGVRKAVDRLWPAVSPQALVRDLLTRPASLRRAGRGVLDDDEQAAILRPRPPTHESPAWTEADVALLDEAIALIEGRARTYGHIVVDEAQELSPMQLRMLDRRCPAGSMTLLGDLAQGSGVWAHDRWDDLLSYLGAPAGIRRAELRLGYRAPAQVLTLASQLLAEAAPHVRPTMAVRPGRSQPSIRRSASADALAADAVKEAQELGRRYGSVAIVCASPSAAALAAALDDARLWWGAAAEGRLDRTFTLVVGVGAKGLEFDAAVVVEPAEFVDDAPHGLRLLYVALTRPTQHLSIAHWLALPEALSRDPTAA